MEWMNHKDMFRKHCMQRLKSLSTLKKYQKDKKIVARLYRYIVSQKVQSILLYLPLSMEVNLYPLILQLRKEKKLVYVPFMEGESFRLVRYRLPLYQKKFAIKEPNDSKQYRQKKIDLAIVPMIGVDVSLRRVGFGKGMYDRFFEKEYQSIDTVVFVSRELCYCKEKITNNYDIRADMIITT